MGSVGGATYDGRAVFYKDVVVIGDLRLGAGESQTTLTSLLGTKATSTIVCAKGEADKLLNAKATAITVYTKRKQIV